MAGPTLGIQRVIQRAAFHCQNSGVEEVAGPNVLVAMYAEPDSLAVSLLEGMDVTRLDVVAYISHQVSRLDDENEEYEGDVESEGRGIELPRNPVKKRTHLENSAPTLPGWRKKVGSIPLSGAPKNLSAQPTSWPAAERIIPSS